VLGRTNLNSLKRTKGAEEKTYGVDLCELGSTPVDFSRDDFAGHGQKSKGEDPRAPRGGGGRSPGGPSKGKKRFMQILPQTKVPGVGVP